VDHTLRIIVFEFVFIRLYLLLLFVTSFSYENFEDATMTWLINTEYIYALQIILDTSIFGLS